MSKRKDSAAQPEVSQPCIHETINASGKAAQELGGGCGPKVWLAKLVIGLAGGVGENVMPRLGLQAYRNRMSTRVKGDMRIGSEMPTARSSFFFACLAFV